MNDDTLLLYFYDDGLDPRERREVEAALAADPELAARYAQLRHDLGQLQADTETTAPGHMVQRWHDAVDRAARQERQAADRRQGFSLPSFAWGAVVTAALAIGIGIGVYWSSPPPATPTTANGTVATATVPTQASGSAFARGLQVHLRDTRRNLTSLADDPSLDRTMLVLQIIQQNRLFERAAEQNDSADLARVLRAFETVLLRLAADDIAPEDAEALREQLAFELNAMLTKLKRDSSKQTETT